MRCTAQAPETFEAIDMLSKIDTSNFRPKMARNIRPAAWDKTCSRSANCSKPRWAWKCVRRYAAAGTTTSTKAARRASSRICCAISGKRIAAFHQDMGDRMEDIVVVTMSEFGRTAKENGNRGTDHGHANCMFVMGGEVKGGKVYWQMARPRRWIS